VPGVSGFFLFGAGGFQPQLALRAHGFLPLKQKILFLKLLLL
jgi:hypothetical protein